VAMVTPSFPGFPAGVSATTMFPGGEIRANLVVPEPSTPALAGSALLVFVAWRRRGLRPAVVRSR